MSSKKSRSETKPDAARPAPRHSATYERAVAEFASALQLLHQGRAADALAKFRAVASEHEEELGLAERARGFIAVCERRTAGPEASPQTPEALYLEGVAASNAGKLDEALKMLDRAVEMRPQEAAYLYARASVRALQGQADPASHDLRRAIQLDGKLRFQALNDPDFEKVRDEASFIDVIEPTPTGA
jgi:tetratricopeptide (TPR) repeat protein